MKHLIETVLSKLFPYEDYFIELCSIDKQLVLSIMNMDEE